VIFLEWVLLILIIVFIIWSIQILMAYRRQGEKIDAQVQLAQANQMEILTQAEQYETRVAELSGKLEALKSKVDGLKKTEMSLTKEVEQYKQQESQRRPTRHKVEPDSISE
jgi:uncharacterized membrane protein